MYSLTRQRLQRALLLVLALGSPAAAREWPGVVRKTRNIGNAWPVEPEPVRLAPSYDVLIHLHRINAADRL